MRSDDLTARRAAALAPSYQLFYDDPIHVVSGSGVWVTDVDGNRLLDCYNNVASVGHAHPRVIAALSRQSALINTHTRYLHEHVVELGERLGTLLTGELSSSIFVCSGSEAVDLAVQIARTVTGHRGVVVTESSYHGNTELVRLLSTDGYPIEERPDWLAVIEPPNTYRGPLGAAGHASDHATGHADDVARPYLQQAAGRLDELADRGHLPAATLIDTSWDSNGVLVAPPEYPKSLAELTRERGGLVIADEVQSGYCRLGERFWGHDRYDLVPDIVTIGKPMGAGHPVAAVVTTPAIAAEFARRRSYFNTFGGNPVSAAVALAVLDVIDDERLLENATTTGALLGAGLLELRERHELIGNVQGSGLFWGLDLVDDRRSREPIAYADARAITTDLRHRGVLTGVTGRYANVLKIRPPLVFGPRHVEFLLENLDALFSNYRLVGGTERRKPGSEW